MLEVRVGCCGLAGMSLQDYSSKFDVVELQSTFYKLPMIKTAKSWREQVSSNFIFTMKAFQGLTHPISSPTWRRAGGQRPKSNMECYGHLRPTRENFECWNRTLEICRLLEADVCVIQLPPSFEYSEQNIEDMKRFFTSVDKPVKIALETRHLSWDSRLDVLSKVLSDIDAIHITDPFIKRSVTSGALGYFRLHGLGRRPYIYNYSDDNLVQLKKILESYELDRAYVMFNNISMAEDAMRFKQLISKM